MKRVKKEALDLAPRELNPKVAVIVARIRGCNLFGNKLMKKTSLLIPEDTPEDGCV